MKRVFILITGLLISITAVFGQGASGIQGVWINEAKDVKVEIYKSGDKYFGKVTWLKDMYEADGKTLKKDSKNSSIKLRGRSIIGIDILSGFSYDKGEWNGGELYNPKSGKTYDSKMILRGDNLEIRGYAGSPLFGKTTVWARAS